MSVDWKTGTLRRKYVVTRRDGTEVDLEDGFFVLRTDTDPHAREAALVYAAASRSAERCRALRENWKVEKADGGKADPSAEYFVLPLRTDRHARAALRAYAKSVARDNRKFAREIVAWLWAFVESDPVFCGCREAMCPHVSFVSKEGMEQLKAEREVL